MSRKLSCLIASLTLVLAPTVAAGDDGHLTREERGQLIGLLEEAKLDFNDLVARAGEKLWSVKPAEDRWSVGEVAEHLLLAERLLYERIETALAGEADPEWAAADGKGLDTILTVVPDRSRRLQAPDPLQPSGEMERAELLAEFAEARSRTLELVRETTAPVKMHTAPNPVLGSLSVRQWLAFIGAHNQRHNRQIAEVIETLEAQ